MPERLERLRAAIQDLERELDSLESLDSQSRQSLEEAVSEIQTALRREDQTRLEETGVRSRLDATLQDFEASHPTVAGLVARIVDLLGQVGI